MSGVQASAALDRCGAAGLAALDEFERLGVVLDVLDDLGQVARPGLQLKMRRAGRPGASGS